MSFYQGFIQHPAFSFYNDECSKLFFSETTVCNISKRITEHLNGVDEQGRNIIVPNDTIKNVMSSIYQNYVPQVGDIFTRLNIPNGVYVGGSTHQTARNDYDYMIHQVISLIVTDVKNNIEVDRQNKKLTIWTTVLGESNAHGLRSHAPIKIRERKIPSMLFNMNY